MLYRIKPIRENSRRLEVLTITKFTLLAIIYFLFCYSRLTSDFFSSTWCVSLCSFFFLSAAHPFYYPRNWEITKYLVRVSHTYTHTCTRARVMWNIRWNLSSRLSVEMALGEHWYLRRVLVDNSSVILINVDSNADSFVHFCSSSNEKFFF